MHPAVCECLFLLLNYQIIYLIPNTPCSSLLSTDMVNTKTTLGVKGLFTSTSSISRRKLGMGLKSGNWETGPKTETMEKLCYCLAPHGFLRLFSYISRTMYTVVVVFWSCYIKHTKQNAPWTHLQANI